MVTDSTDKSDKRQSRAFTVQFLEHCKPPTQRSALSVSSVTVRSIMSVQASPRELEGSFIKAADLVRFAYADAMRR
jgi:hypothetical protein